MNAFAPIPLLDTKGVCRFCGCTEEKPCVMGRDLPFLTGCRWRDHAHTACDSPLCVERGMALLKDVREALHSWECACGSRKSLNYTFCFRCNRELPWEMRTQLSDSPIFDAAAAYIDCLQFLRERTDRLKVRAR